MQHGYPHPVHSHDDPTGLRESGTRVVVMILIAVVFSLMAPAGLGLATFSSLTSLGGIVVAVMGALRGELLTADRFTRWDEAACLMLVSMLAGALVDPAMVDAAIHSAAIHSSGG